jgi:RNA polymerase sigma factor (sigma-70 family)
LRVKDSSTATPGFGRSLDDLYRLHAKEALHVARAITRDPDDAADAVADAFAGVLEALSSERLAGPTSFRPYLIAATRNASIDIVRRKGRQTPIDQPRVFDGATPNTGPSDRLLAGEDRALVAEAFAELPARWRAVLWLTEVESLAPRDVAPLLQLTPNNVAQLAVRARARLRQRYLQMHVRNHAAGDCVEATEHLGGLVAGTLTPTQTNRVRGHLAECAECRARLAELDDLGLSLRRAAIPLGAAVVPGRRRWWSWVTQGGRGRLTNAVLTGVDPSVPSAVTAIASSPPVQQVAASVAAALLVIGVGAAAVRQDSAPPENTRRPAVELAVPQPAPTLGPLPNPAAAADPGATTSTSTPTSTTVVPAPSVAAPAAAPPFTPRGPLARAQVSAVAHALVPQLAIFDAPGGAPRRALANPQPLGGPLVLLVTDQQQGWLQVLLPLRPNGSTGWIRSGDVSLVTHDFRIVVELAAHRITAYRGTAVLLSEAIAVGTSDAPTPGGLYYTTELVQPLDEAGRSSPNGPYGPYAYGLSGFSEVLFDFGGGDGQFGIHGTNDPSSLGRDVSHGCIRMSNAGITRLAGTLPLGVPVEILN